jgi:hypothetical protein
MKHPDYWKLKCLALQSAATRQQAEQQAQAAEQALRVAMREGGLDPDVPHTMDDAAETLTPQAAQHNGPSLPAPKPVAAKGGLRKT